MTQIQTRVDCVESQRSTNYAMMLWYRCEVEIVFLYLTRLSSSSWLEEQMFLTILLLYYSNKNTDYPVNQIVYLFAKKSCRLFLWSIMKVYFVRTYLSESNGKINQNLCISRPHTHTYIFILTFPKICFRVFPHILV